MPKELGQSSSTLPSEFLDRFRRILPTQAVADAEARLAQPRPLAVRVNTLKVSVGQAVEALRSQGIEFYTIPWCPEALVFSSGDRKALMDLDLIKDGRLYMQALSSMLPVLALAPLPGERILDMCAAPGSKATQIAAMMQDRGELVCLEAIRNRFYRLKSVLKLLGVTSADVKVIDGRRFRTNNLFDRILLDVPCSSEGRFELGDPESFAYWSLRKIKEMRQKQRGLILNASRLLKSGGTMVYATCTFAPEENEAVLDWFLHKTEGDFKLVPLAFEGVVTYPALFEWEGRRFDSQVQHGLRVLPTETQEGFFIAKLVKN